ncbi:unnamed protein product [Lactuca saligna]|uniref:Uncharacterized protein n=1 Tax=Lactuca saligna TaxID=75948 RepID=A0AA35Y3Y2_LACSI|nr:unnamed protein product [Lactuca saligna]
MTCNHKWRSYKKRLKKNFLVNENERNPLETYSYLEKTASQKFKERISSKEFQIDVKNLLSGPGEDLLTMPIGPEHPGRTRAMGHDIGLRKGMQGLDKKKRKAVDKEVVSKMQVQLDEVVTQLAELRTLSVMQESRNQVPNNVCFGVQKNRPGSMSTLDALDTIKAITHCDLVLPYGDMNQNNDGLIHSLPLRENQLKVMIDNIYEKYKGIHVPVMKNEVGTTKQGAIITTNSNHKCVTINCKGCYRKNMPNQKINKPRQIESLRDLLKTNLVVHVVADAGHLEVGAFDFSVTYEDYYRLLKKQTTELSIITTWHILLHLMLQKRMGVLP